MVVSISICFSKVDPNLLFTCSKDCTAKLWDLRSLEKPSIIFKVSSYMRNFEGLGGGGNYFYFETYSGMNKPSGERSEWI